MPDQTIALQLNIDTNAPDALDQVNQKIDELKKNLEAATEGTTAFSEALTQLNNAKALLDQLASSMAEQVKATDAGTISLGKYNDALGEIRGGQSGLVDLQKTFSALDPEVMAAQFQKFGNTASDALKGVGTAATMAASGNTDLQKALDQATASALKSGNQDLLLLKNSNAAELKETESFEKSNLDIKSQYQALDLSNTELSAAAKKKILDGEFAAAQSGANALMTLADNMIENGKKNTEAQKATALIKIGIDTARAISSLVAASNENPANAATSGVAGIIQFAAGLAQILANISQAKAILDGGNGGGTVAAGAPSLSTSLSGINTNAPNISNQPINGVTSLSRSTNANTSQQGMIKAYVVESDITQAQQRANVLRSQSLH